MTIVKLLLDRDSNEALRSQALSMGLEPREEYHSTVFYSEEVPLFKRRYVVDTLEGLLPLAIPARQFRLDIFGDSHVVLRYESNEVKRIQTMLCWNAVRQMIMEWPDLEGEDLELLRRTPLFRQSKIYDLNPHITLARGPMPAPNSSLGESLKFTRYHWQANT